jgi:plasmid stability protein
MGEEEGTVRLNLRLPESLHRKLQERAREHHRSLNSEIIDALNANAGRELYTGEAGALRLIAEIVALLSRQLGAKKAIHLIDQLTDMLDRDAPQ